MALSNALHNACRVAREKVILSAYERSKMLVLEVKDDGPGYPQSLLIEGVDLPRPVSGRGTGLGLYLANKIAGLHHLQDQYGFVELSNEEGAVFRMILP
jgi:nitrogen-specific signal transduction histidine kinase